MALEQHTITSACGEYVRDVWLATGPTEQSHRLCVILDAELYLENLDCIPIMDSLMRNGDIPIMTCLFVSNLSMEARHKDYVCNSGYGKFIAEDAVQWAIARNGNVTSGDNLICGLSLSGLAAAHISLNYSSVFSYSLCQSGSFWWIEGTDTSWPRTNVKMWLSVGDQETETDVSHPPTGLFQQVSQIEGVEEAARRFESAGATVRYSLYSGDHGRASWRAELAPALKWLVG